jgi:hypothetical protein
MRGSFPDEIWHKSLRSIYPDVSWVLLRGYS